MSLPERTRLGAPVTGSIMIRADLVNAVNYVSAILCALHVMSIKNTTSFERI